MIAHQTALLLLLAAATTAVLASPEPYGTSRYGRYGRYGTSRRGHYGTSGHGRFGYNRQTVYHHAGSFGYLRKRDLAPVTEPTVVNLERRSLHGRHSSRGRSSSYGRSSSRGRFYRYRRHGRWLHRRALSADAAVESVKLQRRGFGRSSSHGRSSSRGRFGNYGHAYQYGQSWNTFGGNYPGHRHRFYRRALSADAAGQVKLERRSPWTVPAGVGSNVWMPSNPAGHWAGDPDDRVHDSGLIPGHFPNDLDDRVKHGGISSNAGFGVWGAGLRNTGWINNGYRRRYDNGYDSDYNGYDSHRGHWYERSGPADAEEAATVDAGSQSVPVTTSTDKTTQPKSKVAKPLQRRAASDEATPGTQPGATLGSTSVKLGKKLVRRHVDHHDVHHHLGSHHHRYPHDRHITVNHHGRGRFDGYMSDDY